MISLAFISHSSFVFNNVCSQDGGVGETSHSTKLRNFLNMELSPGDRLPKAVCVTCVTNLDYCIQFVDR